MIIVHCLVPSALFPGNEAQVMVDSSFQFAEYIFIDAFYLGKQLQCFQSVEKVTHKAQQ